MYPNVEIVVAPFEDWPLPREPFDAVVSATAFHWIDPDIRVMKATRALRPGGSLAIIETRRVPVGDEQLFADLLALQPALRSNGAAAAHADRRRAARDAGRDRGVGPL